MKYTLCLRVLLLAATVPSCDVQSGHIVLHCIFGFSFPCRYLEGAIGERPEDGFSYKFDGSTGTAVSTKSYVFKPPVFTW